MLGNERVFHFAYLAKFASSLSLGPMARQWRPYSKTSRSAETHASLLLRRRSTVSLFASPDDAVAIFFFHGRSGRGPTLETLRRFADREAPPGDLLERVLLDLVADLYGLVATRSAEKAPTILAAIHSLGWPDAEGARCRMVMAWATGLEIG